MDVLTTNVRRVYRLQTSNNNTIVTMVAIGAMLVGSIVTTAMPGEPLKKGAELGYFAFGGSTIVVLFPAGSVQFDADLVRNSVGNPVETFVKMGTGIGTMDV